MTISNRLLHLTKSKLIHESEANNCFSIITQVIIDIPKQRVDRKMLNFICRLSRVGEQLRALITHGLIHHMVKNGECFSHVLKRSTSKKKVRRRPNYD